MNDEQTLYGAGGDTYLLLDAVLDYGVEGRRVLELGCGRGLLSTTCAAEGAEVTAVDLVARAVHALAEQAAAAGLCVETHHSDLLSALPGRQFDVIAFNPPYVPSDALPTLADGASPRDLALLGGPRGRLVIDRLLQTVVAALAPTPDSRLFMVTCAQNDPNDVMRFAREHGLHGRIVTTEELVMGERLQVIGFARTDQRTTLWKRIRRSISS